MEKPSILDILVIHTLCGGGQRIGAYMTDFKLHFISELLQLSPSPVPQFWWMLNCLLLLEKWVWHNYDITQQDCPCALPQLQSCYKPVGPTNPSATVLANFRH